MAESRSVVIAALFANGAIAVLKFVGYLLTASPAMLSETYHSVSDTGNQIFLLIGLRYGRRSATREHPFGYGKAQFFYSFLVAVLLFGIAGWESARHGYTALVHHEAAAPAGDVSQFGVTVPAIWVNYAVLLGGIVFESWAFSKAYQGMRADITEHDWSGFREAFRKTSNVTTLTAFTEDTIALAGLVFALVGVFLTDATGDPVFDAAAALLIGLLLMGFALALAWENKRLILGESLPQDDERAIREIVRDTEGVRETLDLRTVYFGPEDVVVGIEAVFDPSLEADVVDERIATMKAEITSQFPDIRRVYVEPEVPGA